MVSLLLLSSISSSVQALFSSSTCPVGERERERERERGGGGKK